MKHRVLRLLTFVWLLATTFTLNVEAQNRAVKQNREVAVTFDDLPVISSTVRDLAGHERVTTRLLRSITSNKVPAIGFVNEDNLLNAGELDYGRVALLQRWLDAGLELGNHTFSHLDLHKTPLPMYEEDVIRGEEATSQLLRNKGAKLRYFRHPYLHTGRNIETKEQLERFLADRGYRVAPVTIINSDWIFAAAYERALACGDTRLRQHIAGLYVPYSERIFEYFEQQSVDLFGYEVKQVLLLHANLLNADYFGDLVQMMKRRGYTFVTLDQALRDKAYNSTDAYTGLGGISWLHRWVITKGGKSRVFPEELVVTESLVRQSANPSPRLSRSLRRVFVKFGLLHILVGALVLLLLPILCVQGMRAIRSRKRKLLR